MAFIDIADRTKRSILGDLEWASTYGNQFKDNWLNEQRIPEAVSQTRLGDAQNRFKLSERIQNWQNDLDSSGAQSEWNNWYNNYRLQHFDAITEQEDLNRQWDMTQIQGNLDAFDSQQKVSQLQRDQQILEAENQIEQMTFDRMYDELIGTIPDYVSMSPSQKYQAALDVANDRNLDPRIKARIKRKYIESAESDLENVGKLAAGTMQAQALGQQIQALGDKAPAGLITQYGQLMANIAGYQAMIRDPEAIRLAGELGLITPQMVGYIQQLITGQIPLTPQQQQMGVEAATQVAPFVASQPASQGPAAAQGLIADPRLSGSFALPQPGTTTPVPQDTRFVPGVPPSMNPVGPVGQQQLVAQVPQQPGQANIQPNQVMTSDPNAEFYTPPAPTPPPANLPIPVTPGVASVMYKQPEVLRSNDVPAIITLAVNQGISPELLNIIQDERINVSSSGANLTSIINLSAQIASLPESELKEVLSELVEIKYNAIMEMLQASGY